MTLNGRLFKEEVDNKIVSIIRLLRNAADTSEGMIALTEQYITDNPTLWQEMYTAEEQEEITNLRTTLANIINNIKNNLPTLVG